MKKLIIIGGGEHANVIAEMAKKHWNILGYIDNKETNSVYKYLGEDKIIIKLIKEHADVKLIFGIGNLLIRKRIYKKYNLQSDFFSSIIHKSAIVSESAQIANGVFIGAGSIIQANVKIGFHSIINTGTIIEHDINIGSYTHIASGVICGGGCIIGENSFIGLGTRVNDHLRIGDNVVVGSGSVVIDNIDNDLKVAGIPAKNIKR